MASLEEVKLKVQSNPAVLVYFKNENCAPCLVLRPKVRELIKSSFRKMELVVVDKVERPEFAGEFQVYANPTLLVFF
jgi:thioredoxin 1